MSHKTPDTSISNTPAKPMHVKPNIYTYFMEGMKEIARENGYNLLVHGSMNRDLDLIAVPWVDEPACFPFELVQKISAYLNNETYVRPFERCEDKESRLAHSWLPGGRENFTISMARHEEWNNWKKDEQYYLDISFTPLVKHVDTN